jgi:hypothetical protein
MNRRTMDRGSLRTASGNAHVAKYSTCTAPMKYSCTCLTSLPRPRLALSYEKSKAQKGRTQKRNPH